MNKIKKSILLVAFSALLMFGAIACGQEENQSEDSSATTASGVSGIEVVTEASTQTSTVSEKIDIEMVDEDGFVTMNDYVIITDETATIMVAPDTDSDVYLVLNSGVNLRRIGIKDEWTKIRLNDGNYYILTSAVRMTTVEWKEDTNEDEENISHVVYIDPSKQMMADLENEPVGPDSEIEKAKSATSTIGVSTGKFEYEVTLSIAVKLKKELESRGYTVIISREKNDILMSNSERAKSANSSGAETYIRLQAGEIKDSNVSGILGFVATSGNIYSGNKYNESYTLCNEIIEGACNLTEASRIGIYETDEMTVINWCDMPVAVINVGFLSNETDDENLSNYEYQEKLVKGIANGIDNYFRKIDEGESF